MIIKFSASELAFELTTDAGEKIADVSVGDYRGELNTENLPTIQNELMSVAHQFMANLDQFKRR